MARLKIVWKQQYLVGCAVRVCALYLFFTNICLDVVFSQYIVYHVFIIYSISSSCKQAPKSRRMKVNIESWIRSADNRCKSNFTFIFHEWQNTRYWYTTLTKFFDWSKWNASMFKVKWVGYWIIVKICFHVVVLLNLISLWYLHFWGKHVLDWWIGLNLRHLSATISGIGSPYWMIHFDSYYQFHLIFYGRTIIFAICIKAVSLPANYHRSAEC